MTATEAPPATRVHRHPHGAPRGRPPAHRRGQVHRRPRRPRRAAPGACCAARYAHARIRCIDPSARRWPCPASSPSYTGADLLERVGQPDAVRLGRHRGHEEPAPLPGGASSTVNYVGDAGGRRAGPQRAPRRRRRRSTPSSSTTTRCRPSSTSRTPSSDRVLVHADLGTNTSLHLGAEARTRRRSSAAFAVGRASP